jgi:ERCC4-related helicase
MNKLDTILSDFQKTLKKLKAFKAQQEQSAKKNLMAADVLQQRAAENSKQAKRAEAVHSNIENLLSIDKEDIEQA